MSDADVPTTDMPTDEVPVTYAPDVVGPYEHERAQSGRRRRTPVGIAVRVVVVLAAVAVTYYGVTLFQVWSTGRHDEARPVDAIVVLGAAQYDGRPSPQLAARLDHVLALWPRGLAPIVVVTGGKQPADRFTEAEASARYLVDHGVPEDALVFENTGRSTFESLEGVADVLHARGLRSVLLVTDPFHALRSRLTAEELGLEAYVSPTDTSVVTGGKSFVRHLEEAAGISVGRILGFDRLSGLTG
jgi:uncharacterized SAM-binding protein YcdF (DUF218 family)